MTGTGTHLPPLPAPPPGRLTTATRIGTLLLAYALAHLVASRFLDPTLTIAAVAPAAGIALAALLLNPRRRWLPLLAGFSILHLLIGLATGRAFPVHLGFVTLESSTVLLATWLLTRTAGDGIRFYRVHEILALAGVAAVANAVVGVLGISLVAPFSPLPFRRLYLAWWITHGLGLLILTPLVVVWTMPREAGSRPPARHIPEALTILALSFGAAWLAFGPSDPLLRGAPPPYVLLALVAWAASRFGQRGATAVVALIAIIAVGAALSDPDSRFTGRHSFPDPLADTQLFLAVAAATGQLLAAGLAERKAATDRLGASETRLRVLSDNLPSGMVYQAIREIDGSMRFLHLSAGVERLHGVTAQAALENPSLLHRQIHPEDRPAIHAARRNSLETGGTFNATVRIHDAAGRLRWMHLCSAPRRLPDGRVIWDGIETEITERKRTENELQRLNRALRTLSDCDQAVVHATDESTLLHAVCRVIVQEGGHRLAWIGLVDPSHSRSPSPAAGFGAPDARLARLALIGADSDAGPDPIGTTLRTGRHVVLRQFLTDPRFEPWRAEAVELGFASSITLPMRDEGGVFGVLAIFSAAEDSFDAKEVGLLGELAADIGYGVRTLRARIRHELAQSRVRQLLAEAEKARGALLSILEDQQQSQAALLAINARYQRHEAALATLTRSYALKPESLPTALQEISEVVARTLEIARVGIWTYNSARSALVCTERFDHHDPPHPPPADLVRAGHEPYFSAVDHSDAIAAHHAAADPRTACLVRDYLRPLGVASTLDVPLHARGLTVGVLRCEHTGGVRNWAPDEQTFAVAVANLVSILLAQLEQQQLEAQLRQAQKLEALGTLAGGVAHDFNNILTAIISFSELARLENPDRPELQEQLQQVLQAATRAAGLVRRILLFSRKQKQERRILQIGPVISEALQLLRSTLPATLEIVEHIAPGLPDVVADATQIHQMIMNLGTNAAQAMHGLRGRLTVELVLVPHPKSGRPAHPDLGARDYLRLSVIDTGSGMDAATLTRIFEPFFTTRGPTGGSGLGLAMVHGIVKDHEGVIHVDSQPGRGTRFQVYLPPASSAPRPAPASALQAPRGHGERILYVDDETALCDATRRVLERLGYEAVTHHRPEDAWRTFQQDPDRFAAIITDLTMPGMTGLELAARILELRPSTPIILSSGYIADLSEQAVREHGIRALLQKPVDLTALAVAVDRVLRPPPAEPVTA